MPVVFIDTDGVADCVEEAHAAQALGNNAAHTSAADGDAQPDARRKQVYIRNDGEAVLVSALVAALLRCGLQPSELGVISPYRDQLKCLSRYVRVR